MTCSRAHFSLNLFQKGIFCVKQIHTGISIKKIIHTFTIFTKYCHIKTLTNAIFFGLLSLEKTGFPFFIKTLVAGHTNPQFKTIFYPNLRDIVRGFTSRMQEVSQGGEFPLFANTKQYLTDIACYFFLALEHGEILDPGVKEKTNQ